MTEGTTCYERDEMLCEDQMCLRVGCKLRNERLAMNAPAPTELEKLAVVHCQKWGGSGTDAAMVAAFAKEMMARQAASVGADARIILSSGPPGEEIGFWPSVGTEVAGEADWRKTMQWIADQRYNENADLDDICLAAEKSLASPSRSEGVSQGEVQSGDAIKQLIHASGRLERAETKYREDQKFPNVYPTIRHLNLQDLQQAADDVRRALLKISDGGVESRHADEKPSQRADRPSLTATGASQVSEGSPEAIRRPEAKAGVAPSPSECLTEEIAKWMHDETDHPDSYPDHTWPETERDDGQREGGFVKIVPKHGQAYFRDISRRLVARFGQSLGVAQASEESAIDLLAKRISGAEVNYRNAYELHGAGNMKTGRAWDELRRAGNAIRKHFHDREEGSELPSAQSGSATK